MVETNKHIDLDWFDKMVATLRADQISLETDTANEATKTFYQALFSDNPIEYAKMSKNISNRIFIHHILREYVSVIKDIMPKKLAFDLSGSEILVWAEIDTNDTQKEYDLIVAEAKINAKYHDFGYDLTTTIVESEDNIEIPNHYSIPKL